MANDRVAMILAAGRGERMQPLTYHTPKPLLPVAGKPLIAHSLGRLIEAGCTRVVINCAHLGEQIPAALGDGSDYGLDILYSHEDPALETAGGIIRALPLLDCEHFVVINGDVWCDAPLDKVFNHPLNNDLAHLVMVDNPIQHPLGDFLLDGSRIAQRPHPDSQGFTYSGIGKYSRQMFAGYSAGFRPLRPLLDQAIANHQVSGEHYTGDWRDIGTPERLAELNNALL
ncbi:MAG: hypothetical protein RL336_784 [Pseudomonadota bacterium]